jgi:hypothetical protein
MKDDPDFAELVKRHDEEAELTVGKLMLKEEALGMAVACQIKQLMGMPDFPKSTNSQGATARIHLTEMADKNGSQVA